MKKKKITLPAVFHLINEKFCQPYPFIQASPSIRDLRVLSKKVNKHRRWPKYENTKKQSYQNEMNIGFCKFCKEFEIP